MVVLDPGGWTGGGEPKGLSLPNFGSMKTGVPLTKSQSRFTSVVSWDPCSKNPTLDSVLVSLKFRKQKRKYYPNEGGH